MKYTAHDMEVVILKAYELSAKICELQSTGADGAAAIRKAASHAIVDPLPEGREQVIEECAKAVESYNWVDDYNVQSPQAHQAAIVGVIRSMLHRPQEGSR